MKITEKKPVKNKIDLGRNIWEVALGYQSQIENQKNLFYLVLNSSSCDKGSNCVTSTWARSEKIFWANTLKVVRVFFIEF